MFYILKVRWERESGGCGVGFSQEFGEMILRKKVLGLTSIYHANQRHTTMVFTYRHSIYIASRSVLAPDNFTAMIIAIATPRLGIFTTPIYSACTILLEVHSHLVFAVYGALMLDQNGKC